MSDAMRARLRFLAALGAAAALVAAPAMAAAQAGRPWVVQLGRGAGPWRIGMPFVTRPGLISIERYPENDTRSGCASWSRVDHYRDVRIAWEFSPDAAHSNLVELATSRRGDRSSEGFAIGKTRLAAVVARHPGTPQHPRDASSLGVTEVHFERSTADESAEWFNYWFDASGTLTAIETAVGGC